MVVVFEPGSRVADEQFGRFPHEAADGPTEGLVHFLYVGIGALREVGIWLPDVPTLA